MPFDIQSRSVHIMDLCKEWLSGSHLKYSFCCDNFLNFKLFQWYFGPEVQITLKVCAKDNTNNKYSWDRATNRLSMPNPNQIWFKSTPKYPGWDWSIQVERKTVIQVHLRISLVWSFAKHSVCSFLSMNLLLAINFVTFHSCKNPAGSLYHCCIDYCNFVTWNR